MTRRHDEAQISAAAAADADFTESDADVAVTARAAADDVRHLEEPRTRVRVTGTPGARAYDFAKRENLPEPVEPGQTYRDVRIERDVGGRLGD